jgi:hypothetical protein
MTVAHDVSIPDTLKWHYAHPGVYSEWTGDDQNMFSFCHNPF